MFKIRKFNLLLFVLFPKGPGGDEPVLIKTGKSCILMFPRIK